MLLTSNSVLRNAYAYKVSIEKKGERGGEGGKRNLLIQKTEF